MTCKMYVVAGRQHARGRPSFSTLSLNIGLNHILYIRLDKSTHMEVDYLLFHEDRTQDDRMMATLQEKGGFLFDVF